MIRTGIGLFWAILGLLCIYRYVINLFIDLALRNNWHHNLIGLVIGLVALVSGIRILPNSNNQVSPSGE